MGKLHHLFLYKHLFKTGFLDVLQLFQLTLMKGDKGIKLCQKLANLLLLFYIWCWNRHFKEHTILDGKTVRPRTGIAVEIHEGMPISTFEKVFEVGRINVMRSKYSIKRRHYASSSQFIAVNWADWRGNRNSWIINKILIMNNIIAIQTSYF